MRISLNNRVKKQSRTTNNSANNSANNSPTGGKTISIKYKAPPLSTSLFGLQSQFQNTVRLVDGEPYEIANFNSLPKATKNKSEMKRQAGLTQSLVINIQNSEDYFTPVKVEQTSELGSSRKGRVNDSSNNSKGRRSGRGNLNSTKLFSDKKDGRSSQRSTDGAQKIAMQHFAKLPLEMPKRPSKI